VCGLGAYSSSAVGVGIEASAAASSFRRCQPSSAAVCHAIASGHTRARQPAQQATSHPRARGKLELYVYRYLAGVLGEPYEYHRL
jgi:hypothetical protein